MFSNLTSPKDDNSPYYNKPVTATVELRRVSVKQAMPIALGLMVENKQTLGELVNFAGFTISLVAHEDGATLVITKINEADWHEHTRETYNLIPK